MHRSLQIVTASTCEPLTREEAKAWLRIDYEQPDDDPIVDALVTACRKKVEERCGRYFYQTSCVQWQDSFPSESTGVIRLLASPVVSVTAVTAYDSTDGSSAMSSSDYTVDTYSEPARVSTRNGASWPTSLRTVNGAAVAFTAGYSSDTGGGGSTSLPAEAQPMLSAVKLLLAHLYENRQQVLVQPGSVVAIELPYGVEYLLSGLISPEVEA